MLIPLKYNFRYLVTRWVGTLTTAVTFGLVVGVFVMIMTLVNGVNTALVTSGNPLNVLVMRKGVMAEGQSVVSREQFRAIQDLPVIAKNENGEPLVVPEVLTLINKPRAHDGKPSNIQMRGIAPLAYELRPMVQLVEGRHFRPGLREIIVSKTLSTRFAGFGLNEKVRLGKGEWEIVGLFDAGQSAYNSEIWMDYQEMMQEFDRNEYNTAVVRAVDEAAVEAIKTAAEEDRRIKLVAKTEQEYYEEQTNSQQPLAIFGMFLGVMMGIGACFAGMNTMYSNIAGRSREIGTLRILGYTPFSILVSFFIESVLLAAIGGVVGCLVALGLGTLLSMAPMGTSNWLTFSEVIFFFRVTPGLMLQGMIFALVLGAFGGILPAWRAARVPILSAMREG